MSTTNSFVEMPVLIGGRWSVPATARHGNVFNPSTGEVIARVPYCEGGIVDEAVRAAAAALPVWADTPPTKRAGIMFRYRSLLETHFDELARTVTRENGKTLEEARGDVRRGLEVVEFACGIGQLIKGESLPQVAEHIDGLTMREPVGVCAGIPPFNFPAMVPLWMFPIALACGNTFVLKPSEKVPLTAFRLVELLVEAGLPDGVLNIVHGGKEVVEALCMHPGIAAVSFVGSTPVARRVYALAAEHGKRVQAGGGAKNVLIVMPDADPDATVRAVMGAAFGCAGQRCMAGSILMGVGDAAEPLRRRMVEAMDALKVGDTDADANAEMGPVIDEPARSRITGLIDCGLAEGATLARDGRAGVPARGFFVGPTLLDAVQPAMAIAREEVFGPVLSLFRPRTIEEAIEMANRSPFGNGASIFTASGQCARRFAREVRCGMVGVNVGIPAPMALFPFTGWNQSFFGDLHLQGMEGVMFYTRQKVVLSRWDAGYRRTQGW